MSSDPSKILEPTAPPRREPILDVLRGFAILGILLVNVQFMRGTEWMVEAGSAAASVSTADTIARFVIGWLASGKFLSSLAILFGFGAALIATKAQSRGESPRPLLARRYGWLIGFGLAHMVLLYPGDILFVYGVTGLILLAFVNLRSRALMAAAAALLAFYTATGVRHARLYSYWAYSQLAEGTTAAPAADPLEEQRAQAIAAFSEGSYADIVSVHATQALTLQGYQFSALPWILALFLIGYAAGRSSVLGDLAAYRPLLRRLAIVGIVAGLAANIAVGMGGPLGAYSGAVDPGATAILVAATLGQSIGAPLLAIGYLSALALYCLARGPVYPLAAVGRMALTAYLLQSALALSVIAGLRLYDLLSSASALVVVVGIWTVLLIACPLWLRRFEFGPVEWLWRSLTYGRAPQLRTR